MLFLWMVSFHLFTCSSFTPSFSLSLSNGEAFVFEPLKLESIPGHPLKDYCLVAVATVTQVPHPSLINQLTANNIRLLS